MNMIHYSIDAKRRSTTVDVVNFTVVIGRYI